MDDLKHRIDAYLAHQNPNYAAPREAEKTPSVDEAVLKPIIPGTPTARRSERNQAIDDATRWIAWLIDYRAELGARLPQPSNRLGPCRKASLERGRPARHHL